MKLHRLRIDGFKRFRDPLELGDLVEGLNLFVAPNESGKSTVAEAIRAAFFERHKSSSVVGMRPWNDPSATPTVEIDFDIAGKPARLTKAFLGKKRCNLVIDGRQLDGLAAEDHLGGLLGFSFAGKGASTPEHMGIPGLLWIKQGSSHDIAKPVRFASDYLRNALGDALGELAASEGDEIIRVVEEERNELLTPSTGTPRGTYQEALKRSSAIEAELAILQADIQAYRGGVDRLANLRLAHDREAAERPWLVLQTQFAQAQAQLADAQGLAQRKAAQDLVLAQATAHVNALRDQLQAMEREQDALNVRQANLKAAEDLLRQARGQLHAWEPRFAAAVETSQRAREHLRLSRLTAERQGQQRTVTDLTALVATLQHNHHEAQIQQNKLTNLRADALALAVPSDQLDRLRACSEDLRTAQARLDAISTTLEFELDAAAKVQVGQAPLSETKRLAIAARTDIDIDGVGRITVVPGGEDLEVLIAARNRQQDELTTLLQSIGVGSLAAAEERARRHVQRVVEAEASAAVLAAHAPGGLAALAAELAAQTAKLADARSVLDTLPEDATWSALTVSHAESEDLAARDALEDASTELNEAKFAVGEASAQAKAAAEELAALQTTLDDPLRTAKKTEVSQALTDARAQQSTAQSQASELAQQLQTINLLMLQQDVERLDRSAKQTVAAHTQRNTDITRLEAELEAKGALGQEEAAAEKMREREQLRRRCVELGRRAKALDHLLKLLSEKRSALARRLRAPLQKHLNHYLQILFPGAHVEVGEDLSPGAVTRVGANGAETGEFLELSFGAREQLGVVARLAYADLLKEAGKPTLIILDDALVHTDQERLGHMKRVLYDAANRHQILVFSCHAEAWRDLGVAARSLA